MNELETKLKICIEAYGKDFKIKTRKREFVYVRAAFYTVAYNKKTALNKIGEICGDRDHATVLHALHNVGELKNGEFVKKNGPYMHLIEFTSILKMFERSIEMESLKEENKKLKISMLNTPGTSAMLKLIEQKEELKKENLRLHKYNKTRKTDGSFLDEIDQLPADQKQEFNKFKWQPHKKMLESRKHYPFKINDKRIHA